MCLQKALFATQFIYIYIYTHESILQLSFLYIYTHMNHFSIYIYMYKCIYIYIHCRILACPGSTTLTSSWAVRNIQSLSSGLLVIPCIYIYKYIYIQSFVICSFCFDNSHQQQIEEASKEQPHHVVYFYIYINT